MNRRDLLKRTGTLALGLPALRASGAAGPLSQAGTRELIVSFNGAFCFWMYADSILVMAPPVGPDYECAPHQPWVGTSMNETQISLQPGETPCYNLNMGPLPSGSRLSNDLFAGTPALKYGQEEYLGADALFKLTVPMPDKIIGVRPTCVDIHYRPKPPLKGHSPKQGGQGEHETYASGLTFIYRSVDLSQVQLVQLPCLGKNPAFAPFTPCFENDKDLPAAFLGVHLTKLDQHPDKEHRHAGYVWSQMLSMYPWLLESIKGITFKSFNPASCKCPSKLIDIGPGNDCEVPIMLLTTGGVSSGAGHKQ